jgi:DNA-binding transcriptional ArsR family regulator
LVWEHERSAGDIAAQFDVSWPAISQNLKVLERAGLVTERREGTKRYYLAEPQALGPLREALQQMWEQELDELELAMRRERADGGR